MNDSAKYLRLSKLCESLPPPPLSSLKSIREKSRQLDRTVVVLDDDPTGTQTVYDVPVLTRWPMAAIVKEFENGTELFYILTNSRSVPPDKASEINHEIGTILLAASEATGREFEVISRSDSTLRGHYPAEVDAIATTIGQSQSPRLIIPFFLEGNRLTVNDTHFVVDGDTMVPAAETPFAQDAVFGYSQSNLKDWIEEKTNGKIRREEVHSVSVDALRTRPDSVAKLLSDLPEGSVCIVNSVCLTDLEAFVRAMLDACLAGCQFVCRSAASFVQVRAGLVTRELLTRQEIVTDHQETGGLIVVGSYVPKTTRQLVQLLENQTQLEHIELPVDQLLDTECRPSLVRESIVALNAAINAGRDVVLSTSRDYFESGNPTTNLLNGERISAALVEIASGLKTRPSFLIAKGGITSSDIATKALRVVRANVLGQILPGVPVWVLGDQCRFPKMSYVVFPGNVGDDGALAMAYEKLTSHEQKSTSIG